MRSKEPKRRAARAWYDSPWANFGVLVRMYIVYFALLAVVHGYGLYVVERELAEVYLSVLRVAEFDAVVDHSCMVRAHRADVYGLDASYAPVVFYLHSRKIAERVGHAVAVEPLQFLSREFLRGDHFGLRPLCCHGHLFERQSGVSLLPDRRR